MPISTGININRCRESQNILSRLNSGTSICVEFQISSKLKLLQLLLKTIVTFEFTTLRNYGLKYDTWQYWQVSNLTGIENHKKLLPLLNPPSSLCVAYKISSTLKHLPLFVQNFQNYGLTDDRCLHWQVSILIGVKNFKKLLSPLNLPLSICAEYQISSNWQVLTVAGVKYHRKLLSSMNSAPYNCSPCKILW